MQRITNEQADAILDVVEQCHAVSAAWDQREAAHNADVEDPAAEQTYAQQVERLTFLYVAAGGLAVQDEVLIGAIARNVPEPLSAALFPASPNPAA
jgi:hypothetical protein